MKYFSLTILSFLMISNICISQDAKMMVEISSDTILKGNHIQLRYTIENASGKFEMPELNGLTVISGPNSSSSMSMINGVVTQKASYTVFLKPIDLGVHSIGPAYIETESGILESQPLTIISVDNPEGVQQNANSLKLVEEISSVEGEGIKRKKKIKRFKI